MENTMQTMLSIKINRELKEKAQEVARTLGVSLNAVINQNIKEFISERQVTFTDHPVLNRRTQKILDRLLADSRAGKNIVGPFDTAEEMIKSLRS
jgi:antitoxin component of RelBE/YafQ-DinJ toxin-antitoxin module